VRFLNIKFHENPFTGSLLVASRETDGQTNMLQLIHAFWQLFIVQTSIKLNTDMPALPED
jgi:hypothetical protein